MPAPRRYDGPWPGRDAMVIFRLRSSAILAVFNGNRMPWRQDVHI